MPLQPQIINPIYICTNCEGGDLAEREISIDRDCLTSPDAITRSMVNPAVNDKFPRPIHVGFCDNCGEARAVFRLVGYSMR